MGKAPPDNAETNLAADVKWAYEQYENVVSERPGLPAHVDLTKATVVPPSKGAVFMIRSAARKPEKFMDLVFRVLFKEASEAAGSDEAAAEGENLEDLREMVR